MLGDALRTFELDEKDIDPDDEDPFEEHLSMAAYAIRSSFHATHGHSPAELVFGRNMLLPNEFQTCAAHRMDEKSTAHKLCCARAETNFFSSMQEQCEFVQRLPVIQGREWNN